MQASDLPVLFAFWACGFRTDFRRTPKARGYLAVTSTPWWPFAHAHCLKQPSRCHCRKCGCRRSWVRRGGSARPVSLMKLRSAICRRRSSRPPWRHWVHPMATRRWRDRMPIKKHSSHCILMMTSAKARER